MGGCRPFCLCFCFSFCHSPQGICFSFMSPRNHRVYASHIARLLSIQNQTPPPASAAATAPAFSASCARPCLVSDVKPRLAVVFAHAPLGANPFLLFQSLQRHIQRSMLHQKHIFRLPLESRAQSPARAARRRPGISGSAGPAFPATGQCVRRCSLGSSFYLSMRPLG